MLTLTNPLTVAVGNESYTVYRDDTNQTGRARRGETRRLRFYLLPREPTIALDAEGQPIFSLVVYRRDEDRIDPAASAEDAGGGILTFTVDLGLPEDKLAQIQSRVKSIAVGEDEGDGDVEVELAYVPFTGGRVEVAVAGESGEPGAGEREFVESAIGTGKVSGVGGNRKAVMVKLTQAGAALMSQVGDLRTLPINVQYDLSFEHRLVGVTMTVWCDMQSSYELIQTLHHETTDEWGGYLSMSRSRGRIDKVTSVAEELVRSKTAGVEVTPGTSQIEEETLVSLEKFGLDMLAKQLDQALEASPPPAELDRQWLEEFTQEYSTSFNFTLTRKSVLEQSYSPSANLNNVFQQGTFEDLVTFVDLRTAFFSFLKVPIRVNADFERLPLDSVTVTVRYRRQRVGGGGFEEKIDSFNFTSGSSIQTFLAFANRLSDVAYDWSATVHYRGSERNYTFETDGVSDEFLVIDVGQLGMLEVDLGLGLADLTRFPQAKVSCRYTSGALGRTLEQSFLLTEENQTARWTEVIHEPWNGQYEVKVDWLTKNGEILPGRWQTSTDSRLRVDAPVPDQLEVIVVCTGNFKEGPDAIGQVAVSLRYRDEANDYTEEGQLVFTDAQQQQPWVVDLRNRELRDYQYRYSIIYKDGVVKSFPEDGGWLAGQPGFITVGEKYTLEVDLYPMLLTFPDHYKVVQVDLSYSDPAHGVDERDSFVFSAERKQPQTWRVRGADGGPKTYTYQVTYLAADGGMTRLDPVTQDAEAIVLPPLAAPAPAPGPTPGPTPPGG